MEENASGSSSAVLGAQASEQIQETANAVLLDELFGAEPLQETANAAEVLTLSEEVERLRALAPAPKRQPGRPWGKSAAAPEKRKVGRPAEGEPAPKRAKPGRPVGSKKKRLAPTQRPEAEASADTPPAKRKPGRPKTVKQEVEVETPCETDSGRKPRVKERGPGRPRRGVGIAEAAAADGTQKRLTDSFDVLLIRKVN